MHQTILDYISQFISLTDAEAQVIRDQNLFRQYRKGEVLLAAGEHARLCYFVVKGCVRVYYLKDGEERNAEFFFENQPIRPLSYQTGMPSQYYLACLEDSILALGDANRNAQLLEQVPRLQSLILQMNEAMLVQKTQEFDQFKHHSPEERYRLLLRDKPEHLNRIPLYHLASYLGITQISLSRIRSRISRAGG